MSDDLPIRYAGAYRLPVYGAYPLGNGYRFYLPPLMRFGSPDDWSPFGAGGINPYAYCGNAPIDRLDPSGHTAWSEIGLDAGGDIARMDDDGEAIAARRAASAARSAVRRPWQDAETPAVRGASHEMGPGIPPLPAKTLPKEAAFEEHVAHTAAWLYRTEYEFDRFADVVEENRGYGEIRTRSKAVDKSMKYLRQAIAATEKKAVATFGRKESFVIDDPDVFAIHDYDPAEPEPRRIIDVFRARERRFAQYEPRLWQWGPSWFKRRYFGDRNRPRTG